MGADLEHLVLITIPQIWYLYTGGGGRYYTTGRRTNRPSYIFWFLVTARACAGGCALGSVHCPVAATEAGSGAATKKTGELLQMDDGGDGDGNSKDDNQQTTYNSTNNDQRPTPFQSTNGEATTTATTTAATAAVNPLLHRTAFAKVICMVS